MSKPPLWEVMQDAGSNAPGTPRDAIAAEIRALRDWLVPEPEEPGFTATDEAFAIWEERKALRALLTAEAKWAKRDALPVPVSERLPEPKDCDAEGRCWLLTVEDDYPQWRLHTIEGAQPGGAMIWVPVDSSPGVMVDCFYTSHWLPAQALPVPEAEA